MKIETKCIQAGYTPQNGEPRVLPIYQNTTWKYSSTEEMGRLFDLEESGYFYTRLGQSHQRCRGGKNRRSGGWRCGNVNLFRTSRLLLFDF